jgi:hypothetical protein
MPWRFFLPNKKINIIVRTYEKEDSIFKFIEEWKISFKDGIVDKNLHEVVRYDVKFRDIFDDWLWSQELPPELVSLSRERDRNRESVFANIEN